MALRCRWRVVKLLTACAGGMLVSSCTALVNVPGGHVDVSDAGVFVDFLGAFVSVTDDRVLVDVPGIEVDVHTGIYPGT